ncbi:hypothetical protein KFE25_008231 [Diacronema lutheri]|uniref:Haloacid dehalogenase-like hydrolase n=2 Tax=Diacronema lutheri TaxID=2081491 RepID=A0A8J6C9T3_DIALT|nr:hypothetical protein KFE25_008231 [Diacronema lutheri]
MRAAWLALLGGAAHARAYTLITFDVDGTLVRSAGRAAEVSAHARAFAHAIGRVLGDGTTPTALPADLLAPERYHGSTDGLIALNMARVALGLAPEAVLPRLPEVMECMCDFFCALDDADAIRGMEALPGVLPALRALAEEVRAGRVLCGLVTGNVEGIARKKMRAIGVTATGALSPPHDGFACPYEPDAAVLGGFGSDFCSGDIDDASRQHLDRAEQIAIATRRANALLHHRSRANAIATRHSATTTADGDGTSPQITRVVHVGDAPTDVLAARACAEDGRLGAGVVVGCVAVGTGRCASDALRELAGPARAGVWEPHTLERGLADPDFVRLALGLVVGG